jgi:hypothetical protein
MVLGNNGAENSGKAFSFVDSSESSGVKAVRGQRGRAPKLQRLNRLREPQAHT